MLLVCPSCSSRYNLPDDKIGAEGRLVRCAACKHAWFVMRDPPLDEAALAQALAGDDPDKDRATAARGPSDPTTAAVAGLWTDPADFSGGYVTGMGEATVQDSASPVQPAEGTAAQEAPRRWWTQFWPFGRKGSGGARESARIKPGHRARTKPARPATAAAKRRAPAFAGKRGFKRAGSPLTVPVALLVASVTALVLLVTARAQVVAAAPATARLFATVGLPVNTVGLSFAEVRSTLSQEESGRLLVVEALVRNHQDATRPVPPMEIRLLGPDGRVSYTWTAEPPRATLRAGDSLLFRTRLATPPENARSVEVRFSKTAPGAALR